MSDISRKICLLGDFNVGKTSLVSRFVHQTFSDKYLTTVGVKIDSKAVVVGARSVKLVIWDIAGTAKPGPAQAAYLRGAAGALVVADGTRAPTLDAAISQIDHLQQAAGAAVPWLGLINKADLVDQWELSLDAPLPVRGEWRLTSAATGVGVEEAFTLLAERIEQSR